MPGSAGLQCSSGLHNSAHMDLGNDACLKRTICQCTLSVYFSSILLTISSTQAALPSIPMQNLWPILIREGSSTVAVLKGICYMLENRFFKSFWRSDWGRCFYFFSFNISRNAYKILLQQNSKKINSLYICSDSLHRLKPSAFLFKGLYQSIADIQKKFLFQSEG